MEETTMKKKLALLLTAVLAVSMLGGCGGSSSSGKAEEPAAENTEETEAPAEEAPAEEAVTYQFIDETLGVESYAIGFRLGDEELAQTVSGAMQALVLNGTYAEIGERYPDIKDYLCLKAEDIDEASLPAQGSGDSSYTFKHGFDLDYPPYSYRQDDGTVGGFDVELCQAVCEYMGWGYEAVPFNWDAKDMELNAGSCDCIWSGFTKECR
jgi:polar amino acid transport system substrate-binding protein